LLQQRMDEIEGAVQKRRDKMSNRYYEMSEDMNGEDCLKELDEVLNIIKSVDKNK